METITEKVRVAAVQIAPDLDTPGATVSKVLAAIAEAADKGARLVVFPETFVPWYPYFSFIHPPVVTGAEHIRLYENAVVVPGPVTEAVAAVAKRHGIVVVLGVNERDHGTLYNAQLVFNADGTARTILGSGESAVNYGTIRFSGDATRLISSGTGLRIQSIN